MFWDGLIEFEKHICEFDRQFHLCLSQHEHPVSRSIDIQIERQDNDVVIPHRLCRGIAGDVIALCFQTRSRP